MLVPFLIMLREGLEAALIVGIVAGYLARTGRSAWMPAVWIGIFLAVALALFVGAGLQIASAEFPQATQELFEAAVGLVAVVVLTSMVLWMRQAARSIKAELQSSIDAALSGSDGRGLALVGLVFFAVAREGLESVFFLLAVFQQSPGAAAPLGALGGIALSSLLGYAIYRGGVRLDLARFFRWTGIFILVVAAGLLAGSLRHLHEAGLWNTLQGVVFDFAGVLPEDGVVGTVLSGLFGYMDDPRTGELLVYVLYLGIALTLFLRPVAPRTERARSSASAASLKGATR
ncbi:iron uptake transporter permease EfeU [Aureimonas leprariae]|uniref:Iron transporter n=1 Tax=Plantimonas leprariae TaxID=2615207 RepID=A0A7V7TZ53_9HYPH|nr:iron uptake transporter permease EfeU [Aureimonas leprariae]KAB0678815.1 iron transporter [Aureimonas leprariae]